MLAVLAIVLAGLITTAASAAGDDYPWKSPNYQGMSALGFEYRSCTGFVAWRLNTQRGVSSAPWRFKWADLAGPGASGGGNAKGWKDGAISRGYRVDDTPAIGAVARWEPHSGVALATSRSLPE